MFLVIYFGGMLLTLVYYIGMTRVLPVHFAKANFFDPYRSDDWSKERKVKESRDWLLNKIFWLPLMLVWPWFWFVPSLILLFLGFRGFVLTFAKLGTKDNAVMKIVHRMAGFTD